MHGTLSSKVRKTDVAKGIERLCRLFRDSETHNDNPSYLLYLLPIHLDFAKRSWVSQHRSGGPVIIPIHLYFAKRFCSLVTQIWWPNHNGYVVRFFLYSIHITMQIERYQFCPFIQGVSELSTDPLRYYSWTIDKPKYHIKNFENSKVTRIATILFCFFA
jgi:hypothetical protein